MKPHSVIEHIQTQYGCNQAQIAVLDPNSKTLLGLTKYSHDIEIPSVGYLGSSIEDGIATFWLKGTDVDTSSSGGAPTSPQPPAKIVHILDCTASAPEAAMKAEHDLHHCYDRDVYLDNLTWRGGDCVKIVNEITGPETKFACLATGSIPEGFGSKSSDIDLLVITEEPLSLERPQHELVLAQGAIDDLVFYINGIEFNIEFISQEELQDLMEDLISLGDTMYDSDKLPSFPGLEIWKRRFLHRLRTGWVVSNEHYAEDLRDEYMVNVLPLYESVSCFFEAIEMLEDLYANMDNSLDSQIHMARSTLQWAFTGLCAHQGYTSTSRKWLIHWLEALNQKGIPLAERGIELLRTIGTEADLTNEALYWQVKDCIAEVEEFLNLDNVSNDAISMIRGRLSYTN